MADGKDLLRSKTFWGLAITVAGIAASWLGLAFDDGAALQAVMAVVAAAGEVLGPVLAFVGTIRRQGPITSVGGIPLPDRRF